MDADLPAGHLIVPTAAYRDEGTSFFREALHRLCEMYRFQQLLAAVKAMADHW